MKGKGDFHAGWNVDPSSGGQLPKSRWTRLFKIAVCCLLLWPLMAWTAAKLLIVEAPLPYADVIVVLSGSATYKERTAAAAELIMHGHSNKVLLTNDNVRGPWSNTRNQNPFFYERSVDELEAAGIPGNNIEVLTQPVSGTHDEALLIRAYATEHKLKSIMIVTSAYHSRRTMWVFTRVFAGSGVKIGIMPVQPGIETPAPLTWWFSLGGWRLIPGEYIKMIYYTFMYS